MSPAENLEAIEIPFVFMTQVGPGKHLLHIADRFEAILYCVHSTQYSHLVTLGIALYFFVAGNVEISNLVCGLNIASLSLQMANRP